MTLIVSDTGPLLHLSEAGALDLLRLAGDVYIPGVVEAELAHYSAIWHKPGWVNVAPLTSKHASDANNWLLSGLLDAGEAEAIALAQQMQADWLLSDDAAARLIAESQGLEVHGSLGVVLWAAATGQVDEEAARVALDSLANSSLWVSARTLAQARGALDVIFGQGEPL